MSRFDVDCSGLIELHEFQELMKHRQIEVQCVRALLFSHKPFIVSLPHHSPAALPPSPLPRRALSPHVWQVEARISHLNNDVSMAVEAKGGTGSAVVSNGSLADPSSTVRYEKYAPPPSGTMKLRLVDGAASKTAFKILSASQQEYLIQVRVQPLLPRCPLCLCHRAA